MLSSAAVSVALAYLTNLVASRHRDARLVLLSLAFLASAGFLGLHALATPGVLLEAPNTGFAIATPFGLFIASVFAAVSVTALAGPRAATILRRKSILLLGLVAAMVIWAEISLAGLPPLSGPLPAQEAVGPLTALAVVAVPLFAYAAWRCFQQFQQRGGTLVLASAVALVLLGEAMIAIALSRNWHISWWEWHVLMLAGFVVIALGARAEYRRGGSLTSAFGGLYLEATLARSIAGTRAAMASVPERRLAAKPLRACSPPCARTVRRRMRSRSSRRRPATPALEPALPAVLPGTSRAAPHRAVRGPPRGEERHVSVRSPTSPASRRSASAGAVRGHRDAQCLLGGRRPDDRGVGGVVEHFAGDGIMVSFTRREP